MDQHNKTAIYPAVLSLCANYMIFAFSDKSQPLLIHKCRSYTDCVNGNISAGDYPHTGAATRSSITLPARFRHRETQLA